MDNPKVAIGMLTFDVYRTGRYEMLLNAWASLEQGEYPAERILVTNGSTDGTEALVREMGGIVDDSNGEIWYGMQIAIQWCVDQGADLIVFSADDADYHPGWLRKLVAFWRDMPDEVKIVCPYLSGVWHWNLPRAYIDGGGMRGLVRDSVPGSFWTFRAEDWPLIKELMPHKTPGEDLETCQGLLDRGYMVVEVELCQHIGAKNSAWGNRSEEWVTPLDRERWGI